METEEKINVHYKCLKSTYDLHEFGLSGNLHDVYV